MRYYDNGRIFKRSTKTSNKREATEFAKQFYEQIMRAKYTGVAPMQHSTAFDAIAQKMLDSMRTQLLRKEITKATCDNARYRLQKHILPRLGNTNVNDITYSMLEQFTDELTSKHSAKQLSPSTINAYLKLIKKVLNYAYKHRLLTQLPHFPAVKSQINARGYFTGGEYRSMLARAKKLAGQTFYSVRKPTCPTQRYSPHQNPSITVRAIHITYELRELIGFMVNSYLRPTDIRNLKHKHVTEEKSTDEVYLRLNLPSAKKHTGDVITMPQAAVVYKRLCGLHKQHNCIASADDYLFSPRLQNRTTALKRLQEQFDVLLWNLGYDFGPTGAKRTMYSLRHSAIVFRLTRGDSINSVTLARNARTSVEMIDKFYASQLTSDQNIQALHAVRKKK